VASDKITLIVMHSPKSEPKTFTIEKRRVAILGALLACLLIFTIFVAFVAFDRVIDGEQLSRLEAENQALRTKIASLRDKVANLETAMNRHVQFEEQLRILAGLEPLNAEVWEVGIGGPDLELADLNGGDGGGSLKALDQDIDRLLRQIRLQEQSFSQIMERLKEKSEELRHLPSIKPVDVGYISSGFGRRRDPFTGRLSRHEGVDFSARKGSKVYATADGVVKKAGYERGYGYTIEIDHGNGIITRYAHNAKLLVRRGQKVKRGDVIAYVGNSGRSTAPHLHYEVRVNGVAQNPLKFILPSDTVVD